MHLQVYKAICDAPWNSITTDEYPRALNRTLYALAVGLSLPVPAVFLGCKLRTLECEVTIFESLWLMEMQNSRAWKNLGDNWVRDGSRVACYGLLFRILRPWMTSLMIQSSVSLRTWRHPHCPHQNAQATPQQSAAVNQREAGWKASIILIFFLAKFTFFS